LPEVSLRSPFPPEDVPRIWEWIEPFRNRVSDDFSPKTLMEFLVYFREQSMRSHTWAVYRSGELGGLVTYEKISPVVGTAHCIFKKSFWGRATTMPALQAAIHEMFGESVKLTLPVMDGNKAMLSLLSDLGASREGVLEKHTVRGGKPINVVMLALFRDTFDKEKV
jgi:RimJ/RimL family protein N-acetyltransferase